MKRFESRGPWVVMGVGLLSLGMAAGLTVQHVTSSVVAQEAAARAPREAGVARELSAVFRQVARESMPGVVSIETRGRAVTVQAEEGDESLEGTPFGEMFKNNPELREYFKQRGGPRQMPRSGGMGSGFVIDSSGVILTNNHVVAGAQFVKVRLSDGREYNATEVKTDPRADVAIVRIHPEGPLTPLPLGNSDSAEIGDWVLACGSPFGLETTVTAGIISAKGRGMKITDREDFLQTDAAINPGNSGGPLLNLNGEVIGINTAISTRSGGYDGVGFAVPINMAHWIADQLVKHGEVKRAYLGIAMQDITSDIASQLGIPVGKHALVSQVRPGSPAADAKVEPGDLIVKANGKDATNPRVLQAIVEQVPVGSKYELVVIRDGKEVSLQVDAREMPNDFSLSPVPGRGSKPGKPSKPAPTAVSEVGVDVEAITAEYAEQLGVKEGSGVMVSKVTDNTPGAEAGLRVGMVIEKVGSARVKSPEEFLAAVKAGSLEKGLLMLVRTERGTQFVVVRNQAPGLPE